MVEQPMNSTWPFPKNATIGSVLDAHKGLGPGFDHVRLGLALIIFSVHAGAITIGRPEDNVMIINNTAAEAVHQWKSWRDPVYLTLVPAFFAVSGFLVTSSAMRLRNTKSFLTFRALRIFPALAVEVTLSALVLGPIFTRETLSAYFSDPLFFRYFGNALGFISFYLPGVFLENPIPRIVNNSLWTLPAEFWSYLLLSILMVITLAYRRTVYTTMFVVATVILAVVAYYMNYGMSPKPLESPVIVYYFFCGCLVYHWRDRIPLNLTLYIASGALTYVLFYAPRMIMVAPLVLTYFIVAVGMTKWPRISFMKKGDYSYGIYLYGFPLTQALAVTLPGLTRHTVPFRLSALALTAAFAALSWHFLEKPALRLKAYFVPSASKLPPKHIEGVPGTAAVPDFGAAAPSTKG